MNRRGFFGILALLPFAGKAAAKAIDQAEDDDERRVWAQAGKKALTRRLREDRATCNCTNGSFSITHAYPEDTILRCGGCGRTLWPTAESLERRFDASDKSWHTAWLQEPADPTRPTITIS